MDINGDVLAKSEGIVQNKKKIWSDIVREKISPIIESEEKILFLCNYHGEIGIGFVKRLHEEHLRSKTYAEIFILPENEYLELKAFPYLPEIPPDNIRGCYRYKDRGPSDIENKVEIKQNKLDLQTIVDIVREKDTLANIYSSLLLAPEQKKKIIFILDGKQNDFLMNLIMTFPPSYRTTSFITSATDINETFEVYVTTTENYKRFPPKKMEQSIILNLESEEFSKPEIKIPDNIKNFADILAKYVFENRIEDISKLIKNDKLIGKAGEIEIPISIEELEKEARIYSKLSDERKKQIEESISKSISKIHKELVTGRDLYEIYTNYERFDTLKQIHQEFNGSIDGVINLLSPLCLNGIAISKIETIKNSGQDFFNEVVKIWGGLKTYNWKIILNTGRTAEEVFVQCCEIYNSYIEQPYTKL